MNTVLYKYLLSCYNARAWKKYQIMLYKPIIILFEKVSLPILMLTATFQYEVIPALTMF